MRLFVALLLDAELRGLLVGVQRRLRALDTRSAVRWAAPSGIHLTLKFLGEVEETRVPELDEALEAAVRGRGAPVLGLGELGAFPNARRPRVLWVGLREQGDSLTLVQAAVEKATTELGWQKERRAFQPHLTLGRVRESRGHGSEPLPEPLLEALARHSPPAHDLRPQTSLGLVRSHLSARGARYEELRVWDLAV
ncbi:MAG: RNA 2',3'-cyclic phosphodiesterase [Candidatus Krumholzibacteriia bacterium]